MENLKALEALAQHGTMARAAVALGLTQPAITRRLASLNAEFSGLLFERVGRSVRLTTKGKQVLVRAVAVLAQVRDLQRSATSGNSPAPGQALSVSVLPTVASHILVPALPSFLRRYPEVGWNIGIGLVDTVLADVRSGRADLGCVVGVEPIRTPGLVATPLCSTFLVLAAPRAWGLRSSSPSQLRERRLLLWAGLNDPTFDLVNAWATTHRLVNTQTIRIAHIDSLQRLVQSGSGYTVVPAYTVNPTRTVQTFRLKDLKTLHVELVSRPTNQDGLTLAFAQHMMNAVRLKPQRS